jgi:glycosyltransferase involved in cell wall biosynthesis
LRKAGPLADGLRAAGIAVTVLPNPGGKTDYQKYLKVARYLRMNNVDVVHTHNTEPLLDGAFGAALARIPTIVHTDHARSFPDKRRYMIAEYIVSHLLYRFVAVSNATKHDLVRYERIPRRLLTIIPNGVDPYPYLRPVDSRKVRRRFDIPPWGALVGVIGRLSPEKSVADALDAFGLVLRELPDSHCVIAGEGPCERLLREKARSLGILSRVHFLGGQSDIADIMRMLDVFLLSSVREGLPMALLEAMAGAKPTVATAVGGVPSAVAHGKTGLLVKAGDVDAMAEATVCLLSSQAMRAKFGQAARHRFQQRFSARIMTSAYERLYVRKAPDDSE